MIRKPRHGSYLGFWVSPESMHRLIQAVNAIQNTESTMKHKELRDLIGRAIGAIENPADLLPDEIQHVIEDLQLMMQVLSHES